MTGSLYAPNGCINAGANGPTTITGSFIGSELQVGDYADWTIGTGRRRRRQRLADVPVAEPAQKRRQSSGVL